MSDNIINLFKQGKILARAMENPIIYRQYETNKFYLDFSGMAAEVNEAKTKGKDCASTTLLLADEDIPTYEAIGFLINSEETKLIHIAERDSGSFGEISKGDFHASGDSLTSLDALSEQIRTEGGRHSMNEVNVSMKDNAYIGVFTNTDKRSIALGIMLQKLGEIQTGKKLPLYMYEKQKGKLTNLDFSIEQKINIIKECLQNKRIASSDIYYQLGEEEKYLNILEELEKENTTVLDGDTKITEEIKRGGTMDTQVKYSDYTEDQFSPMYKKVAQKLLTMAEDDETKRKIERYIISRWI